MSVAPEDSSNTIEPQPDIYKLVIERYSDSETYKSEDGHAIFVYERTPAGKIVSEIEIVLIECNLALIIIKSLLKSKEIKSGSLRILNYLNCNKNLTTHQIDTNSHIYKCRCTVPYQKFINEFDDVMKYIESECQQAKTLLAMES